MTSAKHLQLKEICSFHYFESVFSSQLRMKQIRDDIDFSLTMDLQMNNQSFL